MDTEDCIDCKFYECSFADPMTGKCKCENGRHYQESKNGYDGACGDFESAEQRENV